MPPASGLEKAELFQLVICWTWGSYRRDGHLVGCDVREKLSKVSEDCHASSFRIRKGRTLPIGNLLDLRFLQAWLLDVMYERSYPKFRRIVMPTSSGLECKPNNQLEACSKASSFLLHFLVICCFAYSSTLKIKAVYSSSTSVYIYQTTRYHIPEADIDVHWQWTLRR
jgi:hypothetical protein